MYRFFGREVFVFLRREGLRLEYSVVGEVFGLLWIRVVILRVIELLRGLNKE